MTNQQPFLNGKVTPKKSRVKNFKVSSAAKKAVGGAAASKTEVMVKVTGGASGGSHVKAHLDYITRNGKLEGETETGDKINSKEDLKKLAKDWQQESGYTRKNTKDTVNMVFSMPEGTNPEAVKKAVSNLAAEKFGANHRYLMVLHLDQKHPHVHLTVKAQGFNGEKLNPRKADLEGYRTGFAEKLNELGVEATATPRTFRAVVKKGMKQSVYHAEKEGRSTVQKAKLAEIIEELKGGKQSINPAAQAIVEKQKQVRADYIQLAKELGKSPDKADIKMAGDIVAHLKKMPGTLKDERAEMREAMKAALESNKAKAKQPEQGRASSKPADQDKDTGRDDDRGR